MAQTLGHSITTSKPFDVHKIHCFLKILIIFCLTLAENPDQMSPISIHLTKSHICYSLLRIFSIFSFIIFTELSIMCSVAMLEFPNLAGRNLYTVLDINTLHYSVMVCFHSRKWHDYLPSTGAKLIFASFILHAIFLGWNLFSKSFFFQYLAHIRSISSMRLSSNFVLIMFRAP